jgi:hypothetical protein
MASRTAIRELTDTLPESGDIENEIERELKQELDKLV